MYLSIIEPRLSGSPTLNPCASVICEKRDVLVEKKKGK